MKKCILVDLDGTVADASHRIPFITDCVPKDWGSFYGDQYIAKDKLIEPTASLIKAFCTIHTDVELFWVTGRRNSCWKATEDWIRRQKFKLDRLFMRESGDRRKDFIVKSEVVDKLIKEGYDIVCAFDDRTQNVEMYRERGIVCYQVDSGDY